MGKGGVGVMREKAEDGSADDAGAAGQGAQAAEATGGGAEPSVDASGAGGSEAEFDESSLFDRSGRLMVNLEMFRDDNFVQDRIMPLRHVPVLTPRSDEALKRQGLLLEEIMPQFGPAYAIDASKLGTDAFDESIPREIIDHRIGQQEQKRRELVEMLVWERDKIIQDGPGRDLSDLNLGSDESSSAVLNEKRKVEDLKRRQKKKMEQTLLFEIKSQQAEAQHLANLAEQNARAERERKARERRKQQVEQAKRDKEMERKRQEDLETKLRRKQAMEQYKKEQEMNRLIAMKEKARQREQDRRNAELKEKQAQHRREMQEAYEAELRDQAKRQANMEEAERARLARVAKAQKAMQEQKAAQQRRKREKIEKAFKEQERMMQNKWNNFEDKMAQEAQRKADWEREKSQNAERTRMRAEESANYIAGVQQKNDALDEARKQSIHEKNRRAQENRERMARERDYKNALKREQQLQKRMDKLFHLERSKRIADYRKELAWQKMNRSDARTQALEQRKSQLLNERRKMRDLNRDVRVSMQTSMEEFRTKKVFKLPEGIDTAFETPELQTIMGNSSGGALNLSAISAGTPGKPARSASAMETRRPNSRGGGAGGNMSMASVDSSTTMDDFQQFLAQQVDA